MSDGAFNAVDRALSGDHPDEALGFINDFLYGAEAGGPIAKDTMAYLIRALTCIANSNDAKNANASKCFGLAKSGAGRPRKQRWYFELRMAMQLGYLVCEKKMLDAEAIQAVCDDVSFNPDRKLSYDDIEKIWDAYGTTVFKQPP